MPTEQSQRCANAASLSLVWRDQQMQLSLFEKDQSRVVNKNQPD